jgi:AcrR family transcriptional regulator
VATAEASIGLRERKKRQTRDAILAAATRLFEARGYEHVTVAEIADAANISVKTLFTYFRSKEDLAFAGENRLRDQLVHAVAARPAGMTPVRAVARLLDHLVVQNNQDTDGLEGYHREVSGSDALQSRLRRMWENYEDALTAALVTQDNGPSTAARARLTAAMLVAMVRSLTSAEVLADVRRQESATARRDALRTWVATAESMVSCLESGFEPRPG